VRRAADRQHVVDAHHRVRDDDRLDRAADRRARGDLVAPRAADVVGEAPADPREREAADEQEAGDLQEPHDDAGQEHAHGDRAERAPQDHAPLVLARHVARGEADDHGVVACEHEVDHDDRQQGGPPRVREQVGGHRRLRGAVSDRVGRAAVRRV
jgi:hypothetical protein